MTSSGSSKAPVRSKPLLILNAAEERLQVVLAVSDPNESGLTLAAAYETTVPGSAGKFLVPSIRRVVKDHGYTPQDLHRIGCVRGPGGFTGVRQILATALGLAEAVGIPLAGLDYLPLLAAQFQRTLGHGPNSGTAAVLVRAGIAKVYYQAFAVGPDTPASPLSEPCVAGPQEISAALAHLPAPVFLMGSGLRRHHPHPAFLSAEEIETRGWITIDPLFNHPSAETLIHAAGTAEFTDAPIEPLYLKASDAEENLPKIAAARGLDPEKAQRDLQLFTNSEPDFQ